MLASLVSSLKDSASQNKLSKAFSIFSLIIQQTHNASSSDFLLQSLASLLACCSQVKAISQGKQLHAYLVSSGFEKSRVLVPKLVTLYVDFNLFNDAYVVTESSNITHPLSWNVLISGYVRAGLGKEGLSVYTKMMEKGIIPDNFTYPSVLKACGEEFDLGVGREVHESIMKSGLEWNLFVHNALVFMYGKCGDLNVARMLFDEMPVTDEISWNSIISGYASQGMWREAFELFNDMQNQNVEVNVIIWNTIAGGYLKTGNYIQVLKLLSQLRTSGKWDPVAVINGLGACSHIGELNLGKEIHGVAIRTCCHDYDNVKSSLITMYSRCKDLKHAHTVFHLVQNKSVITWNSIISGFSHWDNSEESSFLFREMLLSSVDPNYVTIASILPLCARVANLQHGKEFHCYITRHEGFKDYLLLFNSLIDMYARSGKILLAKRLFDSLPKKDEVTYTSLIAGYGIQGEGKTAVDLFEEMIRCNIKPDHVTMVAVLSACSHSALVDQGRTLFENMSSVYGIVPRLEHFSCMVDLYGRAGLLGKAEETMRKMPYEATPAMWATVIGGCRIHGKKELGEMAAEKLLELRPRNSGYYVLVANMYADSGSWEKLGKVRVLMRELGVSKVPGCAWLDVGGRFMRFLVADTKNVKAFEIYPLLDGLSQQLKEAGYLMSDDKDEVMGL
ncbi:pentatricopeptide repeat-containing protein At1g71490 isoform X1 [Lactuca sativa]|uniref:pentatricopeptide repeat-containing protein At1g71490 isoform X1 n=2 Tax=Lactuca sativa TaxID=4236 RepID=UPI000CBA1117|nr:pentatricopeptide repeat-containing protein At1g71490 isoform X1 [Lactuca sativa]